jgi:hypothetical protein
MTEVESKSIEALHDLLNVGPQFTRQVLNLVEHRLKPAETCLM